MRLRHVPEEETELQLAPMVDIIFQLIIFFLCASTFNPTETELAVNLPVAGKPPVKQVEPPPDEVMIEILDDGGIVVNNREYDSVSSHTLPELTAMLEKLGSIFKGQSVIISPSYEVHHGRVVEVLNACAAAKIENISFYATI